MKILVRAPNWVGDAVMAIPALETIRRTHADDEICVLARPVVADLFSGQPFADRILRYDFRGSHRGWLGREKLIAELRKEKFDIAVLLQNAFEAAWLAWRAGIPERIGYARDGRGPLLTKAIRCARKRGRSPNTNRITISNCCVARDGSRPRRRSRPFVCPFPMRRARPRNPRCGARAQEKTHGAARLLPARLTARPSAGRRSVLRSCGSPDFGMWRRCDIFWHAR